MYICPRCKKEINPDAPSCVHCGVKFTAPAPNLNQTVNEAENSGSTSKAWKIVCIILIALVGTLVLVGGIIFAFRYAFAFGGKDYDNTDLPDNNQSVIVDYSEPDVSDKSDEYIIYSSDSRYITKGELVGMSEWELKVARNEIYARHGRRFKDSDLQSYFDGKSWYYGHTDPKNFDESVFNKYEKANIKVITEYEEEMGYRD